MSQNVMQQSDADKLKQWIGSLSEYQLSKLWRWITLEYMSRAAQHGREEMSDESADSKSTQV